MGNGKAPTMQLFLKPGSDANAGKRMCVTHPAWQRVRPHWGFSCYHEKLYTPSPKLERSKLSLDPSPLPPTPPFQKVERKRRPTLTWVILTVD